MEEILVKSTLDGSLQPSMFHRARGTGRPLLVGLHTWSFDRHNPIKIMLPYAEKYDFNLLTPDFRGSNLDTNPRCREACGSTLAKQDIKDAIDYVIHEFDVDKDNIFLLGISGGGHMSMLMAGYCPEYFKAIGAVVPISDLCLWSKQNANYSKHVIACCGTEEEMLLRSPIHYIERIATANLKIFHGKWDPVVPVSQSISFYNKIMESHPDARVYLDIFDGAHHIDMEAAIHWFDTQITGGHKTAATG